MSSECINLVVAIVSAFVAIVTLIATVIIGRMQIKQNQKMNEQSQKIDERDEQRRNDMIYADATKFILKYSSSKHDAEIRLLPLCVMAYKYNPIYPYRRKMYREFCSMTEETQNCILKRQDIDMKSFKCDNFYSDMLDALMSDIDKNYSNDGGLYYKNGKYFKSALIHYGNKKAINVTCNADENHSSNPLNDMFIDFCKNTMDYETHITNLLCHDKDSNPIERLVSEDTSFGVPINAASDGILISYLACIVAKYVPGYSHSYDDCEYKDIGCVEDFRGTKYMEDLFLDALLNIYAYYDE